LSLGVRYEEVARIRMTDTTIKLVEVKRGK
jgi:hypothetical protein